MAVRPQDPESTPPSYETFLATARAMGDEFESGKFRFLRDERPFFGVWITPGKSSPPKLHVTTPAGPLALPLVTKGRTAAGGGPFRSEARPRIESPAPLTLRSEAQIDRAGKRIGLNREIQTGDAGFDELVYLETEAPDALVLAVLSEANTRAGVMKCLELGASEIVLDNSGNLAVTVPLTSADLITPSHLEALLGALGAAAEAIPPLRGSGRHRSSAGMIPAAAVLGTVAAWLLYYLVDWLWEPIGHDLYRAGAFGGLALWLVSIPILAMILRGRATSLRDLATAVIALAFGFPLVGVDLLLTLNAALDGSRPEEHAMRITSLRRVSGKNSAYFVTLPSWHPGEETIEIKIGSSVFFTLANNQRVVVTTRRGFFGWERMTSIIPLSEPQTSN